MSLTRNFNITFNQKNIIKRILKKLNENRVEHFFEMKI